MRQKIYYIPLLFLAYTLLLGHQLTPHQHYSAQKEAQVKAGNDLDFDHFFSADLGPNHLQNYLPTSPKNHLDDKKHNLSSISGFGISPVFKFVLSFGKSAFIGNFPERAFYQETMTKTTPERGPPFI